MRGDAPTLWLLFALGRSPSKPSSRYDPILFNELFKLDADLTLLPISILIILMSQPTLFIVHLR
jgi:hypothetical protein